MIKSVSSFGRAIGSVSAIFFQVVRGRHEMGTGTRVFYLLSDTPKFVIELPMKIPKTSVEQQRSPCRCAVEGRAAQN